MKAFNDALQDAQKSYFHSRYQSRRLHPRILATHPDFQHRGAATALCQWGIDLARGKREPVTVLSSPLGQQLYSSLGFSYIGTIPVQVEGEQEHLAIGVMVYEYQSS